MSNLMLGITAAQTEQAIEAAATEWTDYTAAVGAGVGTLTAASSAGRYKQIGKTVFFTTTITITTNGTGAGYIETVLPVVAKGGINTAFTGREQNVTGKAVQPYSLGGYLMYIYCYDGTYPGADGAQIIVSGCYEAA
jgi:hypothetical protein